MENWIAYGSLFFCGLCFIAGLLICIKSEMKKEFLSGAAAAVCLELSSPFVEFLSFFFKYLIFGDSE